MARRWEIADDARGQRVRPLGARRWPDDPAAARLSVQFVRLPAGGPTPGRARVADTGLSWLRPVGQTPAAPLQPARAGRHRADGHRLGDNRASRARRARHGHVGHHRAAGQRPSGPLAIRTSAGGAEQRQRDPAPRQPAAGSEIAARPTRSARRTAVQQGEVQPGVRAPFRPEPPAIAGGSRRTVGADRQQRRAPNRAPADLVPRRARALRRALAQRGAGLAENR